MGNTADDRLAERSLQEKLGGDFAHASESNSRRIESLVDKAEDLALTDSMTLNEALDIVSGNTRLPYGTLRPR